MKFPLSCLGLCLGIGSGFLQAAPQKIALYTNAAGATPSYHAIQVLENTLRKGGWPVRRAANSQDSASDELLLSFSVSPGGANESFSIHKNTQAGHNSIQVSGADDIGLAYGAFELLGQIEMAPANPDLFPVVSNVTRAPAVRIRSMAMSLFNRDLEREWYFSREFWNSYFELLAKSRFNQFTLVFGHQTSYLAPLFPFMFDVPGYERVRTPDFSAEDRQRNLATLRMISELANQWGVRFILGIWQFHANNYGRNLVEGLSYDDLFDYCPKALTILLKQCPHIEGVQFRMNSESGIREDDQNRFFTGIAKSVRAAGRPMWIDYRAKGLRPETIASVKALGLPLTVSAKYWREHMGLPYHETRIDPLDKQRSYRRYGYWDLLSQDRPYDVFYRMWSFGSQKILLWGSLDYARQFARSTELGDSKGFEVFAPLSQKGFGNWPGGAWHVLAKRESEYYRWEFERYWAFYLTFGLAGYSAEGPQPVLDGEFRQRFGPGAAEMQQAYVEASWIIPFLTAVRAPSASNFGYWPEMDTDGLTDSYVSLGTGDDNLFYRIDDYVADYLEGRYSARLTPEDIASRLDSWAGAIRAKLERANTLVPHASGNKELSSTQVDFEVLAELAAYHSQRMRSGQDFQFFVRTGERQHLLGAIRHYRKAVDHWSAIVKLTDGVYYDHMVFNRPPIQVGHWKDELPFLKADLARLEEIDRVFLDVCETPEKPLAWKLEAPRHKMTMQWKEEHGILNRWADTTLTPEKAGGPPDRYSMQAPRFVIQTLLTERRYSKILHAPVRYVEAGTPFAVHASLLGPRKETRLTLFYRLAGHGFHFDSTEMSEQEKNIYSASIPAASPGSTILYYIRAVDQTSFFDGSDKEPHAAVVRGTPAARPAIVHSDVPKGRQGTGIRIKAGVHMPTKPAAVRLYYRHLDQSEDWRIVDMKSIGGQEYDAAIPGEFVVPNWDIMYAIEAVDYTGTGAFYPDFNGREPFVVTRIEPR